MPLTNAQDLLNHAREENYRVPAFEIASLDHIVSVIEVAERAAAPLILALAADAGRGFAPALVAMVVAARASKVPVVIEARTPPDGELVARAIRGGANNVVLRPAAGTASKDIEAAVQVARASGVPLFAVDAGLTAATGIADPGPGYRDGGRLPVTPRAACAEAERFINACGATGRAARTLAACRPWREVEHLIVFNVNEDRDARFVEQMMGRGRAVLGAIPGVQRVFTGRALRDDARYRYCWLVRFASPAVVASYRDHPDHTVFANTQFRPVAADRISVDFESME